VSTLSEFMERVGRRVKAPAKSREPSSSRGPVVVLKGWRKGMNKGGVTLCLRKHGASLRDAFDATNKILENEPVTVALKRDVDLSAVKQELRDLGAVVD
jgi:hypothetical protein